MKALSKASQKKSPNPLLLLARTCYNIITSDAYETTATVGRLRSFPHSTNHRPCPIRGKRSSGLERISTSLSPSSCPAVGTTNPATTSTSASISGTHPPDTDFFSSTYRRLEDYAAGVNLETLNEGGSDKPHLILRQTNGCSPVDCCRRHLPSAWRRANVEATGCRKRNFLSPARCCNGATTPSLNGLDSIAVRLPSSPRLARPSRTLHYRSWQLRRGRVATERRLQDSNRTVRLSPTFQNRPAVCMDGRGTR
ncbi:unnamed protein product, partial [Protopolystoma xenopodis]